jgi:hypothetical protein
MSLDYVSLSSLNLIRPRVSQLSFQSEANFEPLFYPLQIGIRFLLHPLPS